MKSVFSCPEVLLSCLAVFCKHDCWCAKEFINLINGNAHQALLKMYKVRKVESNAQNALPCWLGAQSNLLQLSLCPKCDTQVSVAVLHLQVFPLECSDILKQICTANNLAVKTILWSKDQNRTLQLKTPNICSVNPQVFPLELASGCF